MIGRWNDHATLDGLLILHKDDAGIWKESKNDGPKTGLWKKSRNLRLSFLEHLKPSFRGSAYLPLCTT